MQVTAQAEPTQRVRQVFFTKEFVSAADAPKAVPAGCRMATPEDFLRALHTYPYTEYFVTTKLQAGFWTDQIGLRTEGPFRIDGEKQITITEHEFDRIPKDFGRAWHYPGKGRVVINLFEYDDKNRFKVNLRADENRLALVAYVNVVNEDSPVPQIPWLLRQVEVPSLSDILGKVLRRQETQIKT